MPACTQLTIGFFGHTFCASFLISAIIAAIKQSMFFSFLSFSAQVTSFSVYCRKISMHTCERRLKAWTICRVYQWNEKKKKFKLHLFDLWKIYVHQCSQLSVISINRFHNKSLSSNLQLQRFFLYLAAWKWKLNARKLSSLHSCTS